MNRFTRIWNIFTSLLVIAISMIMFVVPDLGYGLATLILGCVLLVSGVKQLLYYLSMGIHMVGGRIILYRALITMDIGLFTISIHGTGQRYIMFYFILYYAFAGIVSVFRALEARRVEAGSWKTCLLEGIYDLGIVLICLINNNSASIMLDILCLSLVISSVTRIMIAFRKSAIIYIP